MPERRARMRYDGPMKDDPAPQALEVRLPGRLARGRAQTLPGCQVAFSLPFLVAGILMIGEGLGLNPMKASLHAPDWGMTAGGAVALLAGVLSVWHALREARNDATRAALLRSRPDEPWLADHRWNARSTADDNLARSVRGLLVAAILGLILIPVNREVFLTHDNRWMAAAVTGVFDLVAVLIFGQGVYLLLRVLKFGTSTLVFRRFPFFLGDTVEANFRTTADLRSVKRLVITLRCLREQIDTESTSSGLNLAVFEVWHERRVVESPSRETPISFRLPAETYFSTELQIVTPRYWELEVTGEAPGVDFEATFLLPVYARPEG